MNEVGARMWMIWGVALVFAGARALISRSGDVWPDLVSWVLLAPLLFAWIVLFFSWVLRRLMRVTWDQSLGFGLEHASLLMGIAVIVDTIVVQNGAHVFTIRSIRDVFIALATLDLYPSSAFTIGTSIGFLVSGVWLWRRLRPHVEQRKLIRAGLEGYGLWMGLTAIPSVLAWIETPRIAWAGSETLLLRAFTLIHQDGYWWRRVFERFPGTVDGELISSERLYIASMLWLGLAVVALPWRSLWEGMRARAVEHVPFFVYGGLIALLMGGVALTLPTSLFSAAVLLVVTLVLMSTTTMSSVTRAGIALTGSFLLGWPVFALTAFLLLCEQLLTSLPESLRAHIRVWAGGISSVAWMFLPWSWIRLTAHPTGIPWMIVLAVLVLHVLPAAQGVLRARLEVRNIPYQGIVPFVYMVIGGLGSGAPGILLGAACGSLALFFPGEPGRFSWKNTAILWVFLVIHAIMVLLHPLRP